MKLAEVGRLMQLLGNRLARTQAGVPVREEADEEILPDAGGVVGEGGSGVATPVGEKGAAAAAAGGVGGGGGGGKGRKKKGKR